MTNPTNVLGSPVFPPSSSSPELSEGFPTRRSEELSTSSRTASAASVLAASSTSLDRCPSGASTLSLPLGGRGATLINTSTAKAALSMTFHGDEEEGAGITFGKGFGPPSEDSGDMAGITFGKGFDLSCEDSEDMAGITFGEGFDLSWEDSEDMAGITLTTAPRMAVAAPAPVAVVDSVTSNARAKAFEKACSVENTAVRVLETALRVLNLETPTEPEFTAATKSALESALASAKADLTKAQATATKSSGGIHVPTFGQIWSSDPILVRTLRLYLDQPGITMTRTDLGQTAFFVKDHNDSILAVVKPETLEPGATPGMGGQAKNGIRPREAAAGELLAYNYSKLFPEGCFPVPATVLAEVSSPTISAIAPADLGSAAATTTAKASLQLFVPDCKSFRALTQEERAALNTEQVQNTAIFDILLANADRHEDNILIDSKGNLQLIDNGLILPRKLSSRAIFAWLALPQAKEALNTKTKEFILKLDPSMLASVIQGPAFRDLPDFSTEQFADRFNAHTVAVELLKQGVKNGLSLYEIGRFLSNQGSGLYEEGDITIGAAILKAWQDGEDKSPERLQGIIGQFMTAYKAKGTEVSSEHEGFSAEHPKFESVCTNSLDAIRFMKAV